MADDDDDGGDLNSLLEAGGFLTGDQEGGDWEYEEGEEEDDYDEIEMLASIDETPVGELSPDQVFFIRDIMAVFAAEEAEDEPYDPDESSAPIVEKLFFRLMDEWQAALEEEGEEDSERVAVLEPTLSDFATAMKAFQKDALVYSGSRRKGPQGQAAVEGVGNLLGILHQLWK